MPISIIQNQTPPEWQPPPFFLICKPEVECSWSTTTLELLYNICELANANRQASDADRNAQPSVDDVGDSRYPTKPYRNNRLAVPFDSCSKTTQSTPLTLSARCPDTSPAIVHSVLYSACSFV